MADNEKRERLSQEIDRLTEENRTYVLGVSQALVFAQEAMNTPHANHEKNSTFLEISTTKEGTL
jgi:hypothetical protein